MFPYRQNPAKAPFKVDKKPMNHENLSPIYRLSDFCYRIKVNISTLTFNKRMISLKYPARRGVLFTIFNPPFHSIKFQTQNVSY